VFTPHWQQRQWYRRWQRQRQQQQRQRQQWQQGQPRISMWPSRQHLDSGICSSVLYKCRNASSDSMSCSTLFSLCVKRQCAKARLPASEMVTAAASGRHEVLFRRVKAVPDCAGCSLWASPARALPAAACLASKTNTAYPSHSEASSSPSCPPPAAALSAAFSSSSDRMKLKWGSDAWCTAGRRRVAAKQAGKHYLEMVGCEQRAAGTAHVQAAVLLHAGPSGRGMQVS
jgi:hypothetical protein